LLKLNKFPEEPTPANISKILQHYRENFFPIFAYATAMDAKISVQMLNEIRNCFDHLSRADLGNASEANIIKAKNHIDRACLDCAKIAWVACKNEVERIFKTFSPKEYSILDGGAFWTTISSLFESFREKSLAARLGETEKMHEGIFEAINLYFEAINIGEELKDAINKKSNDLSHAVSLINKGTTAHNFKWALIGAVLGVILGLLASPLYNYFSNGMNSPKTQAKETVQQRDVSKYPSRPEGTPIRK
jgi:hypothetical protein